jgi:hypothetical protein
MSFGNDLDHSKRLDFDGVLQKAVANLTQFKKISTLRGLKTQ